jgi:hypothetical protein
LPEGYAQVAGDIYWLDIEAQSNNPQDPALWRWQENSRDAAPRLCPAAERTMLQPWHTIVWADDPPRYSEMAFRVTSRPYPPGADPTGIIKSRFISFSVPSGASPPETALRVKFMSLHNVVPPYTNGSNLPIPYTLFEGQSQYVGPPQSYTESNSDPTTFMASTLQCTPHYRDWSTISLLHVTGEAIIPRSSYDVENLAFACQGLETTAPCLYGGAYVSAPLTILTAGSGNVVLAPLTDTWSKVGNFNDIGALVAKYQSNLGAPIKARSKIGTTDKRGLIKMAPPVGFTDIPVAVDAYRGKPYPYKPGKCTGAPTTECKDDTECVGTGPCVLECVVGTGRPCVCP